MSRVELVGGLVDDDIRLAADLRRYQAESDGRQPQGEPTAPAQSVTRRSACSPCGIAARMAASIRLDEPFDPAAMLIDVGQVLVLDDSAAPMQQPKFR